MLPPMSKTRLCIVLSACSWLSACGDDTAADTDVGTPQGSTSGSTGAVDSGMAETSDGAEDSTGAASDVAGRCDYTNPFSQGAECREYVGSGWTADAVQADCDTQMGSATLEAACASDGVLGRCILDGGGPDEVHVVSYGDDEGSCAITRTGCETFAGGTFEPEGVCAGEDPTGTGGGGGNTPFIQPTLECRDPIEGEEPGQGPNGQVCTWQLISAATEEGRRYEDYADCNVVYSQRPYYTAPPNEATDDPRMDDPTYASEVDWVRSQIESTACVCCHSDIAPMGASNWNVDAPGNWVGTFDDTGLAFSVGWIDSTSFGAFAPEDNNGFDRRYGIPTTDPERMRAFFLGELEHRGLVEDDFGDEPAFGGPLYSQLVYEPGECENGERVDRDGTIHWDGGDARYVYVLAADAANPTVPPNLDLPEGTLWRVDVPWDEEAEIASGEVRYGETPGFASQRFPVDAEPAPLQEGEQYYLYVLSDVAIPQTRCIFEY